MVYYPFDFVVTAIGESDYETATGLTGLTAVGCPAPDFPITLEYIDPTQIFTYNVPQLEKRILKAHTLPRMWVLNYEAITDTELAHLRTFYLNRKGSWESFYFIDPDRYVFDSSFPGSLTLSPNLVTNGDYVCTARFDGAYSAERMNKNWYSISFNIVEVF